MQPRLCLAVVLVSGWIGAPALGQPAPDTKLKRIYIAPDDHTDYLWSADEETYRQAFVEMIDYYLDLADATENHPAEHQSRWNCDGSFWLWTYERNKTPEEFDRLLSRIRDGHISVPLNALVSTYGAQPTEAVLRGMYYPGRFFEDFEAHHGDRLPTMSVGFGNEWDLYSASMSEVSARVRRAVERLRAAEGLATLVALERPGFWSARETAREQAWMNLGVYWEHNWTSDSPVITRAARAAWQRRLARQISRHVDTLHDDAAYAMGDLIEGGGEHSRFYVYNPLSWTRTDVADLPLDGEGDVHVVDLVSGRAVPSQLVRRPDPAWLAGRRFARVLAAGIPPVGYRVFEVRPGPGPALDDAATVTFPVAARGGVIENDRYRIEVEPRGAIRSWVDKTAGGRELVREVEGRSLNDLGPGYGTLSVESAGPVSVTLLARSPGPPARETRTTVLRDLSRVELHNQITENFAGVESWAFGFAVDSPDVWHEEVGAVIRARLQGDGGHYAETNSRLDWLTLNHFTAISGADGRGVTLSNADAAFMRLGRSALVDGRSRLDVETPQISVLAGGQVDGPTLGMPAQGGDTRFLQRFALAAHDGFDPAQAMRFALEHQNPLVTGRVRGGEAYPETSFSLLSIDNPDVLLWSVKPAEEGIEHGIVARVWNLAPEERRFSLSLAPGVESAVQTTHIETDRDPVPVSDGALSATAARSQLLTFRLLPR